MESFDKSLFHTEKDIEYNKGYNKGREDTAKRIYQDIKDFFRPFDKQTTIYLDLLLTKVQTTCEKYGAEIKGE